MAYEDPYFKAADRSIFAGVDDADTGLGPVTWKHAKEIFGNEFFVFDQKVEPNDIKQGQLGDCWFMCSIASLAERPQLVRRLFKTPSVTPDGKYTLKFCKNGEWVEVTVDDMFSCGPYGPVFSGSHGKELWVLLMEKAYAKLHGSYMLLRGGWANEGMIDLTGCPTLKYEFASDVGAKLLQEDIVWPKLKAYDDEGALISASTSGEDIYTEHGGPNATSGLVPGHAYTVIAVKEAFGNRLVQIRNPWGQFEWGGDWSDNSPLWTEQMKGALNPNLEEGDGTFWMCFEDFIVNFTEVTICRVKQYHEARVKGTFVKHQVDQNKMILSKWAYTLTVNEPTRLFLGIHQEDERNLGAKELRPNLDLGMVVLKINEDESWAIHKVKESELCRQAELELELDPGTYVIVPRTSGCAMNRPPARRDEKVDLVDESFNPPIPSPLFISTIGDLFRKYDKFVNQDISVGEFNIMMGKAGLDQFEPDVYERMAEEFGSADPSNGLDKESFIRYMLKLCISDEEAMYGHLKSWGYDESLYSFDERVFILTCHSENPGLKLTMRDALKSGISNEISGLLIGSRGQQKSQGAVQLFCYVEEGSGAYNYGAHNTSDREVSVTFDCSTNQGMLFSTGEPISTITIPAGQYGFLLTAMCDDRAEAFGLSPKFRVI